MADLDLIASIFQRNSITGKTLKNKDGHWLSFVNFCQIYHQQPAPVSPETLVRYAVYLIVLKRCTIPTVRNYLSTVRRTHQLFYGVDVPTPTQYLPLHATLKGGAKFLGRNVRQKFPVTPQIQTVLTLTLPLESPYKSLYNLLFFGLPRLGNIVPDAAFKFSSIKHLTWRKVEFSENGVIIELWVTKTIQNFERYLRIPIAAAPDKPHLCLKSGLLLLRNLPQYPIEPDDPVFNVCRKGIWSPLARPNMVKFLKNHLAYLSLDNFNITPSGFRKGGLSHGLLTVNNLELLRLQGDWLSEAYKRYIVIPAEMRFSVTVTAISNMPN